MLDTAADLIAHVGLQQAEWWPGAAHGAAYRPGDPVCMVGAIALARLEVFGLAELATVRAGSYGAVDQDAVAALTRVLPGRGRSVWTVASWSDGLRFARRWRAMRVLRRAAARCRRG